MEAAFGYIVPLLVLRPISKNGNPASKDKEVACLTQLNEV